MPSINGRGRSAKKMGIILEKIRWPKNYIIFANLQKNNLFLNKGPCHKNGEIIYFSKENILAQPTWIYWKTNKSKPVDVVITLFEGNSLKKITRLNRFEVDALYKYQRIIMAIIYWKHIAIVKQRG